MYIVKTLLLRVRELALTAHFISSVSRLVFHIHDSNMMEENYPPQRVNNLCLFYNNFRNLIYCHMF